MADVTLLLATDMQELQANSADTTNSTKASAETILSALNLSIKNAATANRSYTDLLFSSIKTGKYTDQIHSWIALTAENSTEEHKYGITTNENNQWEKYIGSVITAAGYNWIFLYNRDQENPCGLRVSWWKDDTTTDSDVDPIEEAWEDFPYFILPANKYVMPHADEIETNVVQEHIIQTNKDLISAIFATINYLVQTAAKQGHNIIQIPWEALGDSPTMQSLFVKTTGELPRAYTSPYDLFSTFKYGTITDGYYSKAENYTFTTDTFNPMEVGFFNDSTYKDLEFEEVTASFTLRSLLETTLGYDFCYYAGIDPAVSAAYCKGISLAWGENKSGATQSYASETYEEERVALTNANTAQLSWEDGAVPILDDYIATCKENNTKYIKTFIDLTASKMKASFAKGDRVIYILWSEVNQTYADEVKRLWHTSGCQFNGIIQSPLNNDTIISEGGSYTLQSAYDVLMDANFYDASYTDYTYEYVYIRYKNSSDTDSAGSGSNATTPIDVTYANSCGIAIALYGAVSVSPQGGLSTAAQQTGYALRAVQKTFKAKTAPTS